jgi:hypothetical protein
MQLENLSAVYHLLIPTIILLSLNPLSRCQLELARANAAFLAKFVKVLRTSVFFVLVVFKRYPRLLGF